MTTKTTSTTHNAGRSSPHPSEAHLRAGEDCDHDAVRRLLNDKKAFGRALARLIAYVRRHAVTADSIPETKR